MRERKGSKKGAVAVVAAVLMPLAVFFAAFPFSQASGFARSANASQDVVVNPELTPPTSPPPPSTTTSTTIPAPDPNDHSPGWEQRWGQAALARITYPWQNLGFSIQFLPGQPGLLGKTVPSTRTIQIFVREGEPFERMWHALAHELGHAVDLTYGDNARRAQWLQLRGISASLPWFMWHTSDYAAPAGDFAETFAYWQAGPSDYSDFGPPADLTPLIPLFLPKS